MRGMITWVWFNRLHRLQFRPDGTTIARVPAQLTRGKERDPLHSSVPSGHIFSTSRPADFYWLPALHADY